VRRRWWLWLTLLILGSCSAIAVPNFLTAMHRSNQKRTMADIRSIATAIEAYETDHPDWKPATRPNLAALLVPKYIKWLPANDAWNHPFHVEVWSDADNNPSYRIWSAGRDGKRDAKWGKPGYTTNFDNDVVFENGSFTQYPEGV
jgi:type II secretory pathway pseudopilin PulG